MPAERGALRRSYGAREILRLLRVKPHVLRYWEDNLPLVRSARDDSGHRVWNDAQVRMLLRLRHLIVERGMSVQGAGATLLSEAQPSGATAKARLEAVRQHLASLLLDLRHDGPPQPRAVAPSSEHETEALDRRVVPISIEALIEQGFVPPPGETGAAESVPEKPARIIEAGAAENASIAGALPIVYVHQFAAVAAAERDRVLASLLQRRLAPQGGAMVTAWVDEVARTRAVLDAAGLPPERVPILAIRPCAFGGRVRRTPTLALLVALAEDPDLARRLEQAGLAHLYLWPIDVASLGAAPPSSLAAAARRAVSGVALHGWRSGAGRAALSGAAVFELAVWRGHFAESMRAGRWVADGGRPLDARTTDADKGNSGARYEVWLRDLAAIGAPIVVSHDASAVPWRGSDWPREVESLWDRLD